jgi:hypothetical protein
MKFKENNLEKNISRLVKLSGDSNQHSRAFTKLLVGLALDELKQVSVKRKREEENVTVKSNWLEKAIGWAAMFAAACGAGLAFIVAALLKVNTFLAATVLMTTFVNWLNYFGGLIL